MSIQCAITYGEQPLGYAIGPALEAKEALSTIMGKGPSDLREKAITIAGILFEMMGSKDGKQKAERLLKSGKAETKLRQIIAAQGGDPRIKPADIKIGERKAGVISKVEGRVLSINNSDIAKIAREAGAPREKGAGVLLKVKLGDRLDRDSTLFEIFAERSTKLQAALELSHKLQPVSLGKKPEGKILLDRVPPEAPPKKNLVMDR
jgi:AMP phosphorylase